MSDRLELLAANLPISLSLETRRGSPITNTVEAVGDRALHEVRSEDFLGRFDWRERRLVKVLSVGDGSFNCIGLVFGARRVHIHPDQVDLILKEDVFDIVAPDDVQEGDVVVWRDEDGDAQHAGLVGFVAEKNNVACPHIISKWGSENEFLHPPHLVPTSFGQVVQYYRVKRYV